MLSIGYQSFMINMVITMSDNFRLGERIRELRIAQSFSQEQLALRANITPAYLGMVERGEKNPTVLIIEKLCMGLGLSLGEFFAPHQVEKYVPDEITTQIIYQLNDKTIEEKQAVLQLIKQVFKIQKLGR